MWASGSNVGHPNKAEPALTTLLVQLAAILIGMVDPICCKFYESLKIADLTVCVAKFSLGNKAGVIKRCTDWRK